MSFKDIFKKSFLEGYAGADIDIVTVCVALGVASALALYIFLVYRVMTRKTFYSKSFNITLAAVTVITSALILTMQSSVVLSLGMVGALSIVRFRTAIKDPTDLMFLFWAISAGIICGAGLAQIAVILSLVLTAGVAVLSILPGASPSMLLVVNAKKPELESTVMSLAQKYARHPRVKSRNVAGASFDIVIELRTDKGAELVSELSSAEGIEHVSLLSHDGETTF